MSDELERPTLEEAAAVMIALHTFIRTRDDKIALMADMPEQLREHRDAIDRLLAVTIEEPVDE